MTDPVKEQPSDLEKDMQLLETQIEAAKKASNWTKVKELQERYDELERKKGHDGWKNWKLQYLDTNPKKRCLCPECTEVVVEGSPKFCPQDGTRLIAKENKCSIYCGGIIQFWHHNCPKCGKPARWSWRGWK